MNKSIKTFNMGSRFFTVVVILLLIVVVVVPQPATGKKKYQQEVRSRGSTSPPSTTTTTSASSSSSTQQSKSSPLSNSKGDFKINILDTPNGGQQQTSASSSPATSSSSGTQSGNNNNNNNKLTCPRCPVTTNIVKVALEKFWENDLVTAYACACNAVLAKSNDDVAKAILYSMRPAKASLPTDYDLSQFESPSSDGRLLKNWEILGPMNIGKLELDADPTFLFHDFHNSMGRHDHNYGFLHFDPIAFILSMSSENTTIYSDMLSEGKIGWKRITSKNTGQVSLSVHFTFSSG
jgi:hypothetical protein